MARRNLFQPPPPPDTDNAPEQKQRFPSTGAMSGVKSTLKDVASNAVREIPVDVIDEDGPKDRLDFTDTDVLTLAKSIEAHGQQVPIMVRPVARRPGHYKVVYGRRRLRALRFLGIPAKALVRSLSDEEAILAQGQENTQRLDPSFIEKALFAAELTTSGYQQDVILDALAVDKPMLSRMTKVARSIPKSVIEKIGSAHGVGRRRWEDLADMTRKDTLDLEQITGRLDLGALDGSDERFNCVSSAVAAVDRPLPSGKQSAAADHSILLDDGTPVAEVKETARALTFKLSKTNTPEFVQWMRQNAETELRRLYEASQSEI
ncbi:plasmid partitioning protein RepB [Roseobacter sp.]|uniref:plasmid partitioning protein RepB n=1 Tax=Roseobacter sp. TaxID=1907202 RepID=UPI003299F74A